MAAMAMANCAVFRFLVQEKDTELEAGRKVRAFVTSIFGVAIGLLGLLGTGAPSVYHYIVAMSCLVPSVVLLVWLVTMRTAPAALLEGATYVWSMSTIIGIFIGNVRGSPSTWQAIVILLDLCLVNQLSSRVTTILLVGTSSMLIASQVLVDLEVDLPGTSNLEHVCDCENPPCRASTGLGIYLLAHDIFVLLLDFYLTRGFAWKVLEEKASMQSTIDAVQRIAQHLSEYDVDSVAEILDEREGDMPAEMAAALRAVEANLRQYRPYLPDALFEQLHRSQDKLQSIFINAAPGMQTHEATIVFTDIRASTSIWEAVPEAMAKAIRVHNTAIRGVIATCQGYEVKTVGDAFMVAFETAAHGVNFGLRVHTTLAEADWPAALLQMPICAARDTLWRGLTVRVGVNSGPVTPEVSEVTGRVDYFGHTVNVASRLESVCTPGAVCMRADLWAHVQGACDVAVTGPVEDVELKGIHGHTAVCCVWPSALRDRRHSPLDVVYDAFTRFRPSVLASSLSQSDVAPLGGMQQAHATVGVVQVTMGNTGPADLSNSLEELTLHLTRSTGTLVTVLGNSVAVGWNVSRRLNSHAESSLCFARGATESVQCHVGLASGSVEHGDIGSARQRFVTVVGPAVHASWALSEAACEHSKLCLFAWMYNTSSGVSVLPTSLTEHLCRSNMQIGSTLVQSVHEFRYLDDVTPIVRTGSDLQVLP